MNKQNNFGIPASGQNVQRCKVGIRSNDFAMPLIIDGCTVSVTSMVKPPSASLTSNLKNEIIDVDKASIFRALRVL